MMFSPKSKDAHDDRDGGSNRPDQKGQEQGGGRVKVAKQPQEPQSGGQAEEPPNKAYGRESAAQARLSPEERPRGDTDQEKTQDETAPTDEAGEEDTEREQDSAGDTRDGRPADELTKSDQGSSGRHL